MQKTILTIAGSALIVLSTVQFAAASEHQGRAHHPSTGAQLRQSNAYVAPAQSEWPGYGDGGGYYSHGFSAPAGH
jgi:opacity protein-like surface antigen